MREWKALADALRDSWHEFKIAIHYPKFEAFVNRGLDRIFGDPT